MRILNTGNARYEFNNGKAPRGAGLWMFRVKWCSRSQVESIKVDGFSTYGTTFTEAKKKAAEHARTIARTLTGVDYAVIEVLS